MEKNNPVSETTDTPLLMSFGEHLEELRRYLIRIILSVLICFIILFIFKDFIFENIILAPKEPWFFTNKYLCILSQKLNIDIICINSCPLKLINIQLAGQFSAHILITFIASLIMAFPYILWQLWLFIKPALFPYELKNVNTFVFVSSGLFMIGLLFGYFLIVPLTINFLGNYKVSDDVENTISLMSFISTVSLITLVMGFVFQLPVLVYFLSRAGFLSPQWMRKNRKIVFVVILVVSAIITPPDAFSQIMVALPLYFLYEISIFVCLKQYKTLDN